MRMLVCLGILALFAGCVDDDSINRPHTAPVTYGGQIFVAQGQNMPPSTGPIVDKSALTIAVTNRGTQPMLVNDIVGMVNSSDATLTADLWVEAETAATGKFNAGRTLASPVNALMSVTLNNVVVAPGETILLRVFLTSTAASTGDTMQFAGHEVNSSGGKFIPPGNPPQPFMGPTFLAG